MATRSVEPAAGAPTTTITRTLHVEFDREYRSEYPRPRDADHWFDLPLSPDVATGVLTATRTYDLALDDALTGGNLSLRVRAALHGGANRPAVPDKSIELRLNNHVVDTYQWDGMTYTTTTAIVPASWLAPATNQITLTAALSQLPGIGFYTVSPDWVEVTYPAPAHADGRQHLHRGPPGRRHARRQQSDGHRLQHAGGGGL